MNVKTVEVGPAPPFMRAINPLGKAHKPPANRQRAAPGVTRLRNVAERLARSGNYSPEFIAAYCAPLQPTRELAPAPRARTRAYRRTSAKHPDAYRAKARRAAKRSRARGVIKARRKTISHALRGAAMSDWDGMHDEELRDDLR